MTYKPYLVASLLTFSPLGAETILSWDFNEGSYSSQSTGNRSANFLNLSASGEDLVLGGLPGLNGEFNSEDLALAWTETLSRGYQAQIQFGISPQELTAPTLQFRYTLPQVTSKKRLILYAKRTGIDTRERKLGSVILEPGDSWNRARFELSKHADYLSNASVRFRLRFTGGDSDFGFGGLTKIDDLELLDNDSEFFIEPTIAGSEGNLTSVVGRDDHPLASQGLLVRFRSSSPIQNVWVRDLDNDIIGWEDYEIVDRDDNSRFLRLRPSKAGRTRLQIWSQTVEGAQEGLIVDYVATEDVDAPVTFFNGMSNASTAVAIDEQYMLVPDELAEDTIHLYDRLRGGAPVKTWNFAQELEKSGVGGFQVEASVQVGTRIYWVGSQSPRRGFAYNSHNSRRLFATDVSNLGSQTELEYVGHIEDVLSEIIEWDNQREEPFGFQDFAHQDRSPLLRTGISLEGMTVAPDGSTLYLAFRNPSMFGSDSITRSLVLQIKNFESWFDANNPVRGAGPVDATISPEFGEPILLNMGGRVIRDIECNTDGEYLIIGGSHRVPGGGYDPAYGTSLYLWSGLETDLAPIEIGQIGDVKGGSFEGIVEAPSPLAGGQVQLVQDSGTVNWTNATGTEYPRSSSGFLPDHQKFVSRTITLPALGAQIKRNSLPQLIGVGPSGLLYGFAHNSNGNVGVFDANGQLIKQLTGWATNVYFPGGDNAIIADEYSPAVSGIGQSSLAMSDLNGNRKWIYRAPEGLNLYPSEVISDELGNFYLPLYPASGSAAVPQIVSLSPDGLPLWVFEDRLGFGDSNLGSLLIKDGNRLLAAKTRGRRVYELDLHSGSLVEAREFGSFLDGVLRLHALNADGDLYASVNNKLELSGFADLVELNLGNGPKFLDSSGRLWGVADDSLYNWDANRSDFDLLQTPTNAPSGNGLVVQAIGKDDVLYYTASGVLGAYDIQNDEIVFETSQPGVGKLSLHPNGLAYGGRSAYLTGGVSDHAFDSQMEGHDNWKAQPTTQGSSFNIEAPLDYKHGTSVSSKFLKNSNSNLYPGDWALGWSFQPKTDGLVTALGLRSGGKQLVRLFDTASQDILAERFVDGEKGTNFVSIEPIELAEGQSYTMASYSIGSEWEFSQSQSGPWKSDYFDITGLSYQSARSGRELFPDIPLGSQPSILYGSSDLKFTPYGDSVEGALAYGGQANGISWNYSMGYYFSPDSDGTVTGLGGRFEGTCKVCIFERDTRNLVVAAMVEGGPEGRYENIDSVRLEADKEYIVAVYLNGAEGSYAYNPSSGSFPQSVNGVTILGGAYAWTGSNKLAVPQNNPITSVIYGRPDIRFVPAN